MSCYPLFVPLKLLEAKLSSKHFQMTWFTIGLEALSGIVFLGQMCMFHNGRQAYTLTISEKLVNFVNYEKHMI